MMLGVVESRTYTPIWRLYFTINSAPIFDTCGSQVLVSFNPINKSKQKMYTDM